MILVLNSGSSTLKFGCFEADTLDELATGLIDWGDGEGGAIVRDKNGMELLRESRSVMGYHAAVSEALRILAKAGIVPEGKKGLGISAVGHRVVHGGTRFRASVWVDSEVKKAILELSALAPLHNPPALEVIEAAEMALDSIPHVAVFDTAFFADLPARAHVYPLPYEWYSDWGIRRFGFHGISHEYCSGRATELGSARASSRFVICHLGNGCSAAAVRGGRPLATTMGFTPLEGLMMGTRAGSIDPGILVHVQREKGLSPDRLSAALHHESGLLGVSGISQHFRDVERAAAQGTPRAVLAFEIYADRVKAAIGSLAVTLGSVDALVFTGGVGENSAALRAAACDGLQCLDIHLDPERNRRPGMDRDIAASRSRARVWVIHTREEFMIARETIRVVHLLGARPVNVLI
jgi:acetate kinase